jgi:hypothetical protein
VAAEALRRIGELYAVEARVRGQSSAHRLAERRSFSRPIVQALHTWLEAQLPRVAGRSTPAEAIRYAFSPWEGLTRFLHDGRIELDTNPVERAIRPVALGRKNHLFAGSDGGGERWAIICSLIETCKLNGVEPYALPAQRTHAHGRWSFHQSSRRTAAVGLETRDSCQDLTDVQQTDAYPSLTRRDSLPFRPLAADLTKQSK